MTRGRCAGCGNPLPRGVYADSLACERWGREKARERQRAIDARPRAGPSAEAVAVAWATLREETTA